MATTDVEAILHEQRAFEAQLDELLREHANEFVVFQAGKPVGFYPDDQQAYAAAVARFGPQTPFLMKRVERAPIATPISLSWATGVMFG